MKDTLLSVKLSVEYPGSIQVLNDVSIDLHPGEILGLVGQSGCGKSTLALSLLKLLHLRNASAKGSIYFRGHDLMLSSERSMQKLRGKDISLVLQSAVSALNPALRIGKQLEEGWNVHIRSNREQRSAAIARAMESVCLPWDSSFLRRYPNQVSVGQAQRILIAMAILHRPALLIADEPTSALDAITQSEILKLFVSLNRKLNMAVLFISHDLLSVASISHRVAVMDKGTIVECRDTSQLFNSPHHPYTKRLIAALPAALSITQPAASLDPIIPFESAEDTLPGPPIVQVGLQETCP